MSQKRARLRALASLGLSITLFGALVPVATAAGATTATAPAITPATTAHTPATTATAPAITPATTAPAAAIATTATFASTLTIAARATSAAAAPATVAASSVVIALAESHLGARYRYGATGPGAFDCSGLVYRVFEDAGLGRTIAGLHSASALYSHFRARHMTSTTNPQPGDLVIFGGGSHVGIYIGSGRVVHAMVTGVAITRISAVYPRFTTYIHLGLSKLRLPARGTTSASRASHLRVIETVRTIARLSLRVGASTATGRLAVLRAGARLSVVRISRDGRGRRWFEVIAPGGRTGWVAASYTR